MPQPHRNRRQPRFLRGHRERPSRCARSIAHRVKIGQDRRTIATARDVGLKPACQRLDRNKTIVAREAANIVDPLHDLRQRAVRQLSLIHI